MRTARGARSRRWARWLGRNWARLTHGRHFEPTWLQLTHHDIAIPALPAAFEGFRIVHLTDFHAGPHVPFALLREAVELANRQEPDLVALTGDFIHHGYRYIEQVAALVGTLAARRGVFAVLGNHDFSVRNALGLRRHRRLHEAMELALREVGVHVFRNRGLRLTEGGAHLHLAGVDDLWSGHCDVAAAFAEAAPLDPCVLLAHNPRTVERLDGRRCDLMLRGHTHGGQVNWPGLGRILLTRRGRRFAAGLYRFRQTFLYVNRGVGFGSFRFRFGARPEVALLRLRRAGPAA